MGMATLRELASRTPAPAEITVLARPSKRNQKKLTEFESLPGFRIVWGDLSNYDDIAQGVREADFVLHMGGLVSPAADYYPHKTIKLNVESTRHIARAVIESGRADEIFVVYIGSIAQLGDRRPPHHWGKVGDLCLPSPLHAYALSKTLAEKAIVESGIPHWVCLRQTGILCPEILKKGSDPITFHFPLRGVLEWTTAEDSGRLMANICTSPLPDSFCNNFYNIGSGESFRLTNYEFEQLLLHALSCPPPEKIFETDWFALHNFHGQWWADSDELEQMFHFRSGLTAEEYFRQLADSLPKYFRLARFVPAAVIKAAMRYVAARKPLGPLFWRKTDNEARIEVHFGSKQEWDAIPDWDTLLPKLHKDLSLPKATPADTPKRPNPASLTIDDMRTKAAERGGICLTQDMTPGDMATPLKWQCSKGHTFDASAALIYLGGHWCEECLKEHSAIDRLHTH